MDLNQPFCKKSQYQFGQTLIVDESMELLLQVELLSQCYVLVNQPKILVV